MLNEDCKGRLYNYKFRQAVQYLDEEATETERALVESLATLFGNPGWMDGLLSDVVAAALQSVGVTDD